MRLGFTRLRNIPFWDIFRIFAAVMDEKLYKKRYKSFCEVIRIERKYRKISQIDLSKRLGVCQSYISKTEVDERRRRLDIIELLEYCNAMGCTLTDFIFRFEGRLYAEGLLTQERKEEYKRWLDIYWEYHKKSGTPRDARELDEYKKVTENGH